MNWFNNLTIRTKLILSFLLVSLMIIGLSIYAIRDMRDMAESDNVLYHKMTVPITQLSEISTGFQRIRVNYRDAILAEDPAEYIKFKERVYTIRDSVTSIAKEYEKSIVSPEMRSKYNDFIQVHEELLPYLDKLLVLAEKNKPEAITYMRGDMRKVADRKMKLIEDMIEMKNEQAAKRSENNASEASSTTTTMIIVSGIILILALLLGYIISKIISKPILALADAAEKVAAGDVSQKVMVISKDEIGGLSASFNKMVENIRTTLDEVKSAGEETRVAMHTAKGLQAESEAQQYYLAESVETMMHEIGNFAEGQLVIHLEPQRDDDDISRLYHSFSTAVENIRTMVIRVSEAVETTASATAQIAASVEEMSTGASQQAEQTANVAAAVAEMTSNIVEGNSSMAHAVEKARAAGDSAKEGGEVVIKTIEGMNKIAEVVQRSASTVHELGKSSEEIGEIVQVINDIADQTNLLALNAAIEAARAGEQGRGFAVVADEVRKLAERTGEATKQIGAMIKRIQRDTAGAVSAMEMGTTEVENGKILADKAGDSLKNIITVSNDVQQIISQLAHASAEQETTSEDIARNIQNISIVASENNRAIEQVAHATDDLSRLTMTLQDLLGSFDTSGSSAHSMKNGSNGKHNGNHNGKLGTTSRPKQITAGHLN